MGLLTFAIDDYIGSLDNLMMEFTLPRKPNFASYLRDARIKRRLSVAEVAEQVGVSTASIYFWENDRVRPREGNLSALCKVLKLPIRATREMATG
jgi:DNA-binding XRE family transcriptional regulator